MQSTSPSSNGYAWEAGGNEGDVHALAPHWSPRIVYMRADVGHLASPLIPFAVFKSNPVLDFQTVWETRLVSKAEEVESLWNRPFKALSEAQHYFLVAWGTVPRVSPRVVSVAELAFGIVTPGAYYKRWIATRAVSSQGEPVAWCIEIDMLGEQEEVIEIVLNEGNMRHLLPSQLHATSA